MSHKYAQAALTHGDVRLFFGPDVESPPSLRQGFALDKIGSASRRPARNATTIDSYRQSSGYSPPLVVRRNPCNYTTSNAGRDQATFGGPPPMNHYTQAHIHDPRVLSRENAQHQNESNTTGWYSRSRPPTRFTQLEGPSDRLPPHSTLGHSQSRIMPNFTYIIHGEGSTPNGSSRVNHSGIYNGNEVESARGWSTYNRSPTYSHVGYNPAHPTLPSPQNNTTTGFIQPPHDEGLMINDPILFPYQGIDQHGVGSIAAAWPTRNYPSISPPYSSTYSLANSASGNPQDDVEPYLDLPTHGGGSTTNNNLQALREWFPPIDRDNVRYDVPSATERFSNNLPFTDPYHVFPRHSSAYSTPGNPQNNSVPSGTLRQAPYQMTTYRPICPINDSGLEYREDVRRSTCEWNDGNGPCGEDIIVNWSSIKKHVTSRHLNSYLPINHPTRCRWKNCQLKKCIRRDTAARHVCARHFGIKRPKY